MTNSKKKFVTLASAKILDIEQLQLNYDFATTGTGSNTKYFIYAV